MAIEKAIRHKSNSMRVALDNDIKHADYVRELTKCAIVMDDDLKLDFYMSIKKIKSNTFDSRCDTALVTLGKFDIGLRKRMLERLIELDPAFVEGLMVNLPKLNSKRGTLPPEKVFKYPKANLRRDASELRPYSYFSKYHGVGVAKIKSLFIKAGIARLADDGASLLATNIGKQYAEVLSNGTFVWEVKPINKILAMMIKNNLMIDID